MCKNISYILKAVPRIAFNMVKLLLKRLLKMTLRHLFLLFIFTLFLYMLWMYSDTNVRKLSEPKTTPQYPVILWWTMDFPGTSNIRDCPNDIKCYVYSNKTQDKVYDVGAYLFYASNLDFNNLPLPRLPRKKIWGLFHEESPRNVEELLHEKVLNLFNFSSTFSRYSDVPYPLQHLHSFDDITNSRYFVSTQVKNALMKEIAPIMYLQSDCETSTERDAYVKELMKYIRVDSYGACLNNKELPSKFKEDYLNNLNEDDFLDFIAKYKFTIAIENGVCNDYITEKFWRPIKVGSVPMYFGSPSIRDWLPNNKSAILLQDYPTPKILYEHIMKLLKDDWLYDEYVQHKTAEALTNQRLIEEYRQRPHQMNGIETIEKFECFICQKLHDNMKGEISNNIVSKKHYDCPKPISALTLDVNPENSWVYSWETAEADAERIYKKVMNGD